MATSIACGRHLHLTLLGQRSRFGDKTLGIREAFAPRTGLQLKKGLGCADVGECLIYVAQILDTFHYTHYPQPYPPTAGRNVSRYKYTC